MPSTLLSPLFPSEQFDNTPVVAATPAFILFFPAQCIRNVRASRGRGGMRGRERTTVVQRGVKFLDALFLLFVARLIGVAFFPPLPPTRFLSPFRSLSTFFLTPFPTPGSTGTGKKRGRNLCQRWRMREGEGQEGAPHRTCREEGGSIFIA